ncbi:MAG: efflux RND transporter permease subunit [Spirochaetales bacterium]|nr:efflux RND transporter permease subunit [Spirochaetales bacterium]
MLRFIFRKELGVLLFFFLLCVLGVSLVGRFGVQLYPRTSRPALMSTVEHRGYSAIAFSRAYGEMIETQLMGIQGVDRLEITYGSNSSRFTLTFDWEVDAEQALLDTQAAIDQIEGRFHSDFFSVSRVRFFAGENAGFLILGMHSPTVVAEDLFRMAGSLESRLSQVEDVEIVEILNVEELNVDITLRNMDLLNYGLTIQDVNYALFQQSAVQSVGSVREGRTSLSVYVEAEEPSLFDLAKLVVKESNGSSILLEDIADVEVGYTIPSATFVMEGNRGIQIVATPLDGGNIRNMSQEITRLVEQAREDGELPEDTQISLLLDPADYINRSIRNVVQAALLGAFLAMLMVFLTLGKVRNTLLIGISLPVSLILSFILLYYLDISLNLISLGGMALAVGMIVDSSIVVIENIHRFRQDENHTDDSEHLQDLILRAVAQVRSPVIASTLTSILVFLPIRFTAPLTNAILGEQSLVVVAALSFALLVALTLVPLIAYLVYRRRLTLFDGSMEMFGRTKNVSSRVVRYLENLYLRLLRPLVLSRRKGIILIAAAFLAFAGATILLLPRIPREILSPPNSDRLIVFTRPTEDVESAVIVQEVFPAMTRIIQDELGSYISTIYGEVRGRFNRLFVVLHSPRDAEYVKARLEELFVSDNDWYYSVMSWDPASLPLPRTNDLQISVQGPDETEVIKLLERVRDMVSDSGIYQWVSTVPATNYTDELVMHPRKDIIDNTPSYNEAALVGLLQRSLVGTQVVEYQHEGLTVNARAEFPDELLQGRTNFQNFLLPYQDGALPVKHFFDFSTDSNAAQIASEDGELIFRLYANLSWGGGTTDRAGAEAEVKRMLSERLALPEGYSLQFDNPQAEMDAAIRSLFISLALSVALIYLLLTFQFNSFIAPLVILISVPMGFLGLLLSLFLFHSTLSLNSLLGSILLSGVVVNNAIILLDFYLRAITEYNDRKEALLETARVRFRPILITTLTTIMGMLPIALGLGEGANVIQPLGIAVSGGLAVSTVMTLFVVPSVLSLIKLKPKK